VGCTTSTSAPRDADVLFAPYSRSDRSLAIAPDLEDLYMPPPDSGTGKKKRGKKATGTLIPEESEA